MYTAGKVIHKEKDIAHSLRWLELFSTKKAFDRERRKTMSKKIVQFDEQVIKSQLAELVRQSVEETLNALLEEEATRLLNAESYERCDEREGYRAGHYSRNITTKAGEVSLDMPKLKGITFQTAIIERYKRRESSVEEALVEMYLAGVSTRKVSDITEILWDTEVSASTVSKLNKEVYSKIESWRNRRLSGVRLIIADRALGILSAAEEVFPKARYQRCVVHFYRNVFSKTPTRLKRQVAKMLKAIHAQESKEQALKKSESVIEQLEYMKLIEAAKVVRDGIGETLTYMDRPFPFEHWVRIRTNNALERLNREIKRRTEVVGSFPDGNSALMLVAARCKYVAESQWGQRRYLDISRMEELEKEELPLAG